MAKTNAEDKNKSVGFLGKVGLFFKGIALRIARAFKDMYAELHKVTWPSKQDLINYSMVVLVFMVFMGVVIGLFDGAASELVRLIVGN